MEFYMFDQNNSGGHFTVNEKLCHRLIIEANDKNEAIAIAEELGVYFDGVEKSWDCSCCGDRWYGCNRIDLERTNEDGYEVSIYDHYSNPEETWYNKYGEYKRLEEPKWKESMFKRFEGRIYFETIEEYIQFLADEYGWTTPDARIFYKNGDVKEIYSKKERR